MKKLTAIMLLLSMALSLTACTQVQATDLMEAAQPQFVETVPLESGAETVTDFSVKLFQQAATPGENTLVSPISVLCALAMTANGAQGNTLEQMEAAFGMDMESLNSWFYSYLSGEREEVSMANSLWFRDDERFFVRQEFLQKNADYYGAAIYKAAFDDTTCKDINHWVEQNTDGMIKDILDEIPYDAVMYLVNALAFDAQWRSECEAGNVFDGLFHIQDAEGTTRDVELMHFTEGVYLEDEYATGFVKYYKGGHYAFAALLPNEGVSVEEYVATLTGEHLQTLLEDPQYITVYSAIPKFEAEYGCDMSQFLNNMGIIDAFDPDDADLSGIGSSSRGNLFISRVIHKTFISVDEQGTKAGAATVVEVSDKMVMVKPADSRTVTLDRPFVYMIIDCERDIPIFLGTLTDPEG